MGSAGFKASVRFAVPEARKMRRAEVDCKRRGASVCVSRWVDVTLRFQDWFHISRGEREEVLSNVAPVFI